MSKKDKDQVELKADFDEFEDDTFDDHDEESSEGDVAVLEEDELDLEEDGYDGLDDAGEFEQVEGFDASALLDMEAEELVDEGEEISLTDDLKKLVDMGEDEFGLPETQCGRDDRVQIDPTTGAPWRWICQLLITSADGSVGGCTGWFIGPRTVMTAGHCVYSRRRGGWAKKIEVIPAANGRRRPYGSQTSTRFRSVKGWVKHGKESHDYGAIILPNGDLGRRVGWFGFANLSKRTLKKLRANHSGYPCDKPFGTQWFNAGKLTKVSKRRLQYMIDTFGCQSGSPVWRYHKGRRYAIGVHAYGGCPNKATRINKAVFKNMKKWKNL